MESIFQSTLSVRRATQPFEGAQCIDVISIHALREESDNVEHIHMLKYNEYFNPRSPWGERPFSLIIHLQSASISIHALREESDASCTIAPDSIISYFNPRSPWGERRNFLVPFNQRSDFNPRSPWGERQACDRTGNNMSIISIHALREESDASSLRFSSNDLNFNPRSPWGERLVFLLYKPIGLGFQSTLSVRRATSQRRWAWLSYLDFNPRSPWGERQYDNRYAYGDTTISIHALREESDLNLVKINRTIL